MISRNYQLYHTWFSKGGNNIYISGAYSESDDNHYTITFRRYIEVQLQMKDYVSERNRVHAKAILNDRFQKRVERVYRMEILSI